jgi:hypothetical protein
MYDFKLTPEFKTAILTGIASGILRDDPKPGWTQAKFDAIRVSATEKAMKFEFLSNELAIANLDIAISLNTASIRIDFGDEEPAIVGALRFRLD